MSDFIKVDDSQIKELQKRLARWVKVAPEEVKKVLTLGGEMVRREAQERHLNGPKMPRGVGDPMNATLGRRSSRLFQSIALRVMATKDGKFSAQVGTNVRGKDGRAYGREHELGLNGMPARPFLRPSLIKKRPKIFEMISKEFLKSYGK